MDNLLERASIVLTPTAYNDAELLCVKPEDGSGDFDFSRNSSATRVNAQGLVEDVQILSSDLVQNGDFSNGSTDWSFTSGAFLTDIGARLTHTPTAGVLTSDGYSPLVVGNNYKMTYEITQSISGGIKLNSAVDRTMVSTVGVHTKYFEADAVSIGFARTDNTANDVTIDNISVKEVTNDTNLPRINYENGCGHLLFEPQSTNLYLNSEILATQTVTTTAIDYTVSFYGTGTVTFSGSFVGSLVGTGVNDRVSLTFTATAGTLTSTISGSVTKGQCEALSYATSYIPTSGVIETRNQDLCTGGGSVSTISSTEGTLYFEGSALADDGTTRHISISDGTTSNAINIYYFASGGVMFFQKFVNGVRTTNVNTTSITKTDFNKIAVRYNSTEFSVFANGVNILNNADTNVFAPNTLNTLQFTSANGTSSPFFGKTKALAVWKEALSDQELLELTTL